MEDISVLHRSDRIIDKKVKRDFNRPKLMPETAKNNPVINELTAKVDENFINYLNWHGLADEPNLLVLSSRFHYYYDNEELNLKKLNLIKHLDDFLHTVNNVLSPKTNFIGCFSDRKTQKGVSVTSRIYKRFINFLDSRIDIEIDKKDILRLFESHGFKVIDMTEINGLTYFRTQNN
jgi:hypothetical protein